MNSGFRYLAACAAAVLAAAGWAFADTVLMKDNTSFDGKILSRENGLIRMQSGKHEVILPEADTASVESNDKVGEEVNYDEIEQRAAERDRELVEKTGLQARDRSVVDEQLKIYFLGDEESSKDARGILLGMVKDRNPYRYLEMLLPGINPAKVAPLLEVMFEMNPEAMRETLEKNAVGNSETARAACLRCLAKLRGKSALELIRRGMADEYPEVRIAAAHGIEALSAREATPVLLKALKDDDMRVQNAARDALSILWTESGQPPLNFLQNSGWEDFWKSKAAGVSGAWDPALIEPLVPKGTVVQMD